MFGNAANQSGPTLIANSNPGKDAYIGKYSSSGSLTWVIKLGGSNIDVGKSILWEPNGYCTIAGNFSATITVTSGVTLTAASASSSYFIARYNGLTTGLNESATIDFNLNPNPAESMIHILIPNQQMIDRIEIYSLTGALLKTEKIGFSTSEINYNAGDLASGSYMLRLITDEGQTSKLIQIE